MGNVHSRRRKFLLGGPLFGAAALFVAATFVRYRRFRQTTDYLFYSTSDFFRAWLLALRTKNVRNMVLAAVFMTMALRRAGIGLRKRMMLPTIFLIMWLLYYRFSVCEHRASAGSAGRSQALCVTGGACYTRARSSGALQAHILEPAPRGAGAPDAGGVPADDVGLEQARNGTSGVVAECAAHAWANRRAVGRGGEGVG